MVERSPNGEVVGSNPAYNKVLRGWLNLLQTHTFTVQGLG